MNEIWDIILKSTPFIALCAIIKSYIKDRDKRVLERIDELESLLKDK
ncbi:MAG: hypothetical protein Q4B52_01830 [Tissierellia bacterium]|nr:hypothetical protein [Tissierellia bacterium]